MQLVEGFVGWKKMVGNEHVCCMQAPVLLSLNATYANAAVPTAAHVLLVRLRL